MTRTTSPKRQIQCMLGSSEWPVESVGACMAHFLQDTAEGLETDLNMEFNEELDEDMDGDMDGDLNRDLNGDLNGDMDETLQETLKETLDETLNETLNETPNETLNETLNQSYDQSLEVTSNVISNAGNVNDVMNSNVNVRPSRAAKRRAISRIQNIHHWENCTESSVLFRQVARQVDHEIKNELLHADEVVTRERGAVETHNANSDGSIVEESDDESMTESMKDFIVPDDEEFSEEEDSEASFKPNEDEEDDDALQTSSDEESEASDNDTVHEAIVENEADLFFAAANDELNTFTQDEQSTQEY